MTDKKCLVKINRQLVNTPLRVRLSCAHTRKYDHAAAALARLAPYRIVVLDQYPTQSGQSWQERSKHRTLEEVVRELYHLGLEIDSGS